MFRQLIALLLVLCSLMQEQAMAQMDVKPPQAFETCFMSASIAVVMMRGRQKGFSLQQQLQTARQSPGEKSRTYALMTAIGPVVYEKRIKTRGEAAMALNQICMRNAPGVAAGYEKGAFSLCPAFGAMVTEIFSERQDGASVARILDRLGKDYGNLPRWYFSKPENLRAMETRAPPLQAGLNNYVACMRDNARKANSG